ncbi:Glucoamylase precursor [Paenibacillus konkukensis]|uniref:Glucoamylase n=1 Tax=Paenibacillus konkukensis TaxID=2020716 RepID=A0ABY4RWW3_9BACL|nr:glycoside hydrolase family 15 protein [Paenibacillus konkukensis]UQZ86255.1 Glucoamylase precursor [Paenibacillus konkukensis]
MPRPLVIGNGKILINFDDKLRLRDLYYPFVGQLNHVGGHFCKMGVWASGLFNWLDEDVWQRRLRYRPESLVTDIFANNDRLRVEVRIEDGIHQRDNIYLKKVSVRNRHSEAREVRLFFHHDFTINETEVGDTAVYDPRLNAVYHYKRNVYILANGKTPEQGIYQYSIGIKRFNHAEGTWRDAEDGVLGGNAIAQGSVDSTISFRLLLQPDEEQTMYYWLCVGEKYSEVRKLNHYVVENDAEQLLKRVEVYWQGWVNKERQDFADLPSEVIDLYKKSLLIVKTQMDRQGAIIAANDTDILQFNRDHYSYMWPRDGALVALAMSMAGYDGTVASFYKFCSDVLTKDGYLLHKYNPDGSTGSSWHPFIYSGELQLPIQEDETALVLYSLWEFYTKSGQIEYCQELYASLIRPAASFMQKYVHHELNLPLPSYDLWEERCGIFTFTCSAVFAGLQAAAHFAKLFGDEKRYTRYHTSANQIKEAMLRHLYDEASGRFLRGIYVRNNGEIEKDYTVESSMYSLFAFGVLPADDPRVIRTMEAIQQKLCVRTNVGGYARYEGDYYFKISDDLEQIPGNPWLISTLWIAEWNIAKAQSLHDLREPLATLLWVCQQAMESGVLPEQIHPLSGEPLSVAPLTWSHSTLVMTVVKYTEKYRQLQHVQETLYASGGTAI